MVSRNIGYPAPPTAIWDTGLFYRPESIRTRLARLARYVKKWEVQKLPGTDALLFWRSAHSPFKSATPVWGGEPLVSSRYGDPGVYVPNGIEQTVFQHCGAGISISPKPIHAYHWAKSRRIVPVLVFPEDIVVPDLALRTAYLWDSEQPYQRSKARAAAVVVLDLPLTRHEAWGWVQRKGWK